MNPIFKRGDTFVMPIEFFEVETQQSLPIIGTLTAAVIDSHKLIHTDLVIQLADQSLYPGKGIISCNNTSEWHTGLAYLDLKLEHNSMVKHTQDFKFYIERSIAP